MSKKIHAMVTERIVIKIQEAIKNIENGEKGLAPWHCPWFKAGAPKNLVSKKAYRGLNVFMLSMMGYASPYWVSYKQASKLGGKVKKGEKGTPIIFWKWIVVSKDQQGNALPKPKKIPFLRYFTVFNTEQCEGLGDKVPELPKRVFTPIESAERVIANMPHPPTLEHNEARAYYRPSTDSINMPKHELFEGEAEYYSTSFHEHVHSTGHADRLGRKEIEVLTGFGSHDYSIEELVAEMGAIFLCNEVGLESTFDNSLSYLKGWLKKLKDDTTMLVTASGRAQKAVDYILDRKPEVYKKDDND